MTHRLNVLRRASQLWRTAQNHILESKRQEDYTCVTAHLVKLCCCNVMSENALSMFVNYGMGVLKPSPSESVYHRTVDGVSVNTCAELCLNETSFYCLSFDIIFTGAAVASAAAAAASDAYQCKLSRHVAVTAGGLVVDTVHPQHNHYERIGVTRSFLYCCDVSTHP